MATVIIIIITIIGPQDVDPEVQGPQGTGATHREDGEQAQQRGGRRPGLCREKSLHSSLIGRSPLGP